MIAGIVTQIPVLAETDGPSFVERFIHNVSNNPTVTSSLTGLGLFIAASGVFGSIRKSVNILWGISRPRAFWTERGIDFFMMTAASALIFLSIVLSAIFSFIEEIADLVSFQAVLVNQWVVWIGGFGVPATITYIVFVVVYWWLPNTKVRLLEILGVAFLATVAFEITKGAFILFLRNSGDLFASIYGSITTIMMFFFFTYIEAIILLAGAMLSAKWSNHLRIRDQKRQNQMLINNLRRINESGQIGFLRQSSTRTMTAVQGSDAR